MSVDLVIRGTVVTPDATLKNGWVAVEGRTIHAVGTGEAPVAKETYEAGDAYVLPGIIDGQTHAGSYLGLPGIEPTTRSAIAGGVTTLVDMPYDSPEPLSSSAHLATKVEAIHRYAHANWRFMAPSCPANPWTRCRDWRKVVSSASRSLRSRAVRHGFPALTPP